MSYVAIIIILGAVACVAFGLYLIVTSRRKVEPGPRCGQCGYNLTGATANRCPECGNLFIETGVVMQVARSSRVRLWVGIGLLVGVVPLFCLGTGALLTFRQHQAARQAQAAAMQARQQAQRAQAQAAAQNQPPNPVSQPIREAERRT